MNDRFSRSAVLLSVLALSVLTFGCAESGSTPEESTSVGGELNKLVTIDNTKVPEPSAALFILATCGSLALKRRR